MKALFKFLDEKFHNMPAPVQVLTYLTFLILFVYITTRPSYLDMKLVSMVNNEESPVGDAVVEVETADRDFKILTDQSGRFSVPISSWLPTDSIVFVLRPDPQKDVIKEVEIPFVKSYKNRIKLVFNKKDTTYQISYLPKSKSEDEYRSFPLINTAFAKEPSTHNYDDISKKVMKLLAAVSDKPTSEIKLKSNIYHDLYLDNIDVSYVNSKIKNAFNADIWKTIRKSNTTVNDVIDAIANQLGVKHSIKVDPDNFVKTRYKTLSINEINQHCQEKRKMDIRVTTEENWRIAAATIRTRVSTSSKSSFTGLSEISQYGFNVTGYIQNKGSCGPFWKDDKGHIRGQISYNEYACPPSSAISNNSSKLDSDKIVDMITNFYNEKGKWAKTFILGCIEKIKVEKVSSDLLNVHTRYFYVPILYNVRGRKDIGHDERIFTFIKKSNGWHVEKMSQHMTAVME